MPVPKLGDLVPGQRRGSDVGANGVQSEIGHLLVTASCELSEGRSVRRAGAHALPGEANSLSDHAALLCRIEVGA